MSSFFCVWVNWIMELVDWWSHFKMMMILGTIPIWLLVFHVCLPGCFVKCAYKWVLEKFFWFKQSTQRAGLCPSEIQRQFSSRPAFSLFGKLSYIFLVDSRNRRVSWMDPLCLSCIGCHFLEGRIQNKGEDWPFFEVFEKPKGTTECNSSNKELIEILTVNW